MTKKKVLLVLNRLCDYRVETYNQINEVFDFTVGYNVADESIKHCEFRKIKFSTKKVGPFHIFGRKFWKECKKYDAVITSFDIHNFEFAFIPFIKRKYKLLTWSIGLRCSYTRPYDVNRSHQFLDKIAYRILQAADANIFYMDKAREFWKSTALDQSKIFIAPNTTGVVEKTAIASEKSSILFVGTLYKTKGVDKLLTAFHEAISSIDNLSSPFTLDIVGKGEELNNLKSMVEKLGLDDKVIFHGAIYDENELSALFSKALVCVSPTQAGLTVPKSMGYGVPVVTKRNAITGGEIYHIAENETGIIYDRDEELAGLIKDCMISAQKYIRMGANARSYYKNNATIAHQANGVIKALTYSFSTK
ncbi:MAG: glycosyltransferase family 4 protein [Bacteroidales bacterium]|nr:glycosyltransferase family 4 protein [Bacteroidales bacterium]